MSDVSRLRRLGRHRVVRATTAVLAGLVVLVVLLAPVDFERFTPSAFLRFPMEVLIGSALVLVLPARIRRIVAGLLGVALGLLAVVKVLDIGFDAVLYRPFDLVLDWPLFGPAVNFLEVTIGKAGAIGAVVGAAMLVVAFILVCALSVLRLTSLVVRHRAVARRGVAAIAVAWIAVAVTGVVPSTIVTSDSGAGVVYEHARQVRRSLHDQKEFAAESAVDPFRNTPSDQLLSGLRGKDVIVAFVESYGRSAIEQPQLAPQIGAVLDEGTRRLRNDGFASRSAFLTSPTAGGGSWLAQATLLSGLRIDNQQRYQALVAGDRLTLPSAFRRANWRSVGVVPGITRSWPEGEFFNYDRIYSAGDLGYRGPRFGYSTMPDQYTLAAFERLEHAKPDQAPLMAMIPLVTSHAPWPAPPRLLDWGEVGDGSIYNSMIGGKDSSAQSILAGDPAKVRADYGRSIEYSVNSLVSYVETYGDDNLVLVFLGDHQPAGVVTGPGASHDVPITLVARDAAVLDRISGWGWQDGLKPGPTAPVWPMEAFRDKFLSAFGSQTPAPPHH